jgi:hypothetical protein
VLKHGCKKIVNKMKRQIYGNSPEDKALVEKKVERPTPASCGKQTPANRYTKWRLTTPSLVNLAKK